MGTKAKFRSCIFCEGRANSKEDAWPLWLLRRLGVTEAGIIEGQLGKQAPTTWRTAHAKLTVRFVCTSCNNGWMSQLQQRVKPTGDAVNCDSLGCTRGVVTRLFHSFANTRYIALPQHRNLQL